MYLKVQRSQNGTKKILSEKQTTSMVSLMVLDEVLRQR